MSDFIALTCPNCGGRLQITDEVSRFACGHCGNEHLVRREGGAIYLAPIAIDVRHIRTGVDKTAAELAVSRLTPEVRILTEQVNALKDKSIHEIKEPELLERVLPALAFVGSPALCLTLTMVAQASSNPQIVDNSFLVACVPLLALLSLLFGSMFAYGKIRSKRTTAAQKIKDNALAVLEEELHRKSAMLHRNISIANSEQVI